MLRFLMSSNISDQIIIIKNLLRDGKFSTYKLPTDKKDPDFIRAIIGQLRYNVFEIPPEKNYKNEYFYPVYEFITNNVITNYSTYIKTPIMLNYLLSDLFEKLTILKKGHILLTKLDKITNNFIKGNETIVYDLLEKASNCGTLITFLFWLQKTPSKKLESIPTNIRTNIYEKSIGNSDDRLFKYILEKINQNDKLYFQQNAMTIQKMISTLSASGVPPKYALKRIKILSNYISLIPYFNHMIQCFNSYKIIMELHKHYYVVPHTYQNIQSIFDVIKYHSGSMDLANTLNCNLESFINILKTPEEKQMMMINCILDDDIEIKFVLELDYILVKKIIRENMKILINTICWSDIWKKLSEPYSQFYKMIVNYLVETNYIKNLLESGEYQIMEYNKNMLFFTKFYSPEKKHFINTQHFDISIKINVFLHNLRMFIRRKNKNKQIERKVRMFDVLNEIKNFNPVKNVPVLARGSHNYQIEKQKFNNLPPRHLLPGEFSLYDKFLMREKADGILINNLPIGIHPMNDKLVMYQVKAEYIEELDLYLIFDIDIPNTTIIERYNYLRNLHPATKQITLNQINSLNDFIELMKTERIIIQRFLSESSEYTAKWYPKFACLFENNKTNKIYQEIIQNIILETDPEINQIIKESKPFNCDGIIISPLDGSREIKIKPKSLSTIDLIYSRDGKWLDRNSNDWSNMIIKSKQTKKSDRIYRLYPEIGDKLMFRVGEFRYDKKQPNPHNIVDTVINLINYDWQTDGESNDKVDIYYQQPIKLTSNTLINLIQSQNKLLSQKIMSFEPNVNMNWLDLGCGKGKLIPFIRTYKPKYYLGLDSDIKQLVKCLKYHDENQMVYNFTPCNLAKNWNESKNKWLNIKNGTKFDYVVANFSIMHFFTEDFWNQLNEYTHSETKFLFNVINSDYEQKEWSESKSFLEIGDSEVTYKFEWIHNTNKTEPLIKSEKIRETLTKYGWDVITKWDIKSEQKLLNFYSWYLVKKNI